jgi:hypothetical protein
MTISNQIMRRTRPGSNANTLRPGKPSCLRGDLLNYLSELAFTDLQFQNQCDQRLEDHELLELCRYVTTASDAELYVALELQQVEETAGIQAAIDAVRREAARRGLKRRVRA